MPVLKSLEHTGSLSELRRFLQSVAAIRFFEESIADLYPRALIRCPVHLAIGHEASAVGVCSALANDDKVLSYHRSHHHYLAMGGDPRALLFELLGDPRGCSGGRGGSTHLYDPGRGFLGSTAIISGAYPVATGVAHALKLKRSAGIVACFGGDASVEEGIFFESMNIAALWGLPLLTIIEDNDLSCYTARNRRQAFESIRKIAELYSMPFADVSGADVMTVHFEARRLMDFVRENGKPALLRIRVYRVHEHCGPDKDDHLTYRKTEGEWPENDPLLSLIRALPAADASGIIEAAQVANRKLFSSVLKELGHADI